eukprot:2836820-Rhodomonas_salina.1
MEPLITYRHKSRTYALLNKDWKCKRRKKQYLLFICIPDVTRVKRIRMRAKWKDPKLQVGHSS